MIDEVERWIVVVVLLVLTVLLWSIVYGIKFQECGDKAKPTKPPVVFTEPFVGY